MSKRIYVWPEYFDSTLSRRLGRRVPISAAVPKPSLNELIEACKSLQLKCEPLPDKKYPRTWYKSHGCIAIELDDEISKATIIKKISEILKKFRENNKISK